MLYYVFIGKLLRAFPLQDENTIVKDISEQLCDLIRSGQGNTFVLYEKLIVITQHNMIQYTYVI